MHHETARLSLGVHRLSEQESRPVRPGGPGHVHQYLNGEEIISDSNGEKLNEREARSILGRNEKRLREAYELGNKPLFAAVCMYQQMSDDEWHKAKEEAEKEAEDCPECTIPEVDG